MSLILIQYVFYFILLITLSIPLGNYISQVMTGQKVFLSRALSPIEKTVYKTEA